MKRVSIYCLIDPRSGNPFYVGATVIPLKTRLSQHINMTPYTDGVVKDKFEFICEIIEEGFVPVIKLIRKVNKDSATYYERFYIKKLTLSGHRLIQRLDGCYWLWKSFSQSILREPKKKIKK